MGRLSKPSPAPIGGFQRGLASGPSGDVNLPSAMPTTTQSWVQNQAWLESLRYNPDANDPYGNLTGLTHTSRQEPSNMEAGVRVRLGLAELDPAWRPDLLLQNHNKLLKNGDALVRRIHKYFSESMLRLTGPSPRDGEAEATGTSGHDPTGMAWMAPAHPFASAADAPAPPRRRPRPIDPERLVALATPKPKRSHDIHLHEWEIRARQEELSWRGTMTARHQQGSPRRLTSKKWSRHGSRYEGSKAPLLEVKL